MKKILCLVALDESSNDAIEYAAQFAQHTGAELTLLHILSVPQDTAGEGMGYLYSTEKLEKKAWEKLQVFQTMIQDQFGISCQSLVKPDLLNLNKEIQYEADAHIYELVVMGTNGAENFRQFLFGVNSDRLIKRLTVPLLIVPQGCHFKKIKQIVYASDYETSDAYVVRLVQHLTAGFDARVMILHVSKNTSNISDTLYKSMVDELDDELNDPRVRYERVFSENAAPGIDQFMKQEDKDLLVMLSKTHSFFDRLFGAHVIQQINSVATYPLLVIHAPVLKEEREINPKNVFF